MQEIRVCDNATDTRRFPVLGNLREVSLATHNTRDPNMRLILGIPILGKSKEKLRKSRAGFNDRTFATLRFIDFRVTKIVGTRTKVTKQLIADDADVCC